MLLLETKAVVKHIDPWDWPRCRKCDMPVEEFEATDTGDSLAFVARCHGEEELVQLPDSVWDDDNTYGVEWSYAFEENGDD